MSMDDEDIWMIHRARRSRLLLETAESLGIAAKVGRQHFDRHLAAKRLSVARYTSPMPPAPIRATTSYGRAEFLMEWPSISCIPDSIV